MNAERGSVGGDSFQSDGLGQDQIGLRMSVVNRGTHPRPDFTEILEAMHMEKGLLLQPTMESLMASYESGQACALMDEERPVGYVRFSPLLDANLKERLGVDNSVPDVYEIGSAIILPDHRGKGYYPRLRNGLLGLVANRITSKELLVIGTTKSIRVVEVLKDAKDLGIDFSMSRHGELPGIQCLTCVCNPDFGVGVQHGTIGCPKAITEDSLTTLKQVADWRTHRSEVLEFSPDGKIPCVLYVSDMELARQASDKLVAFFGSRAKLIKQLREAGHYE